MTIVEADKKDFYRNYDGSAPGLVFLDAHHGYESTREDIAWARAAGAEIICGRDYSPRFPGVIRAATESGGTARVVGTLFELARASQQTLFSALFCLSLTA